MSRFILTGFSDEIDEKVEVQFQTMKELGIPYFEARGIDGKNIADLTDEDVEMLCEKMKEYEMKSSSIGSPIGKISITEDFESHFQRFKRVVDSAKKLHTKYIRIFSFYIPDGQRPEVYRDEVFSRLRRMCEYARSQDVILLHENEKDIYGDTIERCTDLMREFHSEYFKAVFDPANFVQCGENAKEAFLKLKPYIAYMHIKDATGDGEVVPAGVGRGEIPFILRELKRDGYEGFLSLEPHLGSFSGLENLEIDDKMMKLEKSSAKTFIHAYNALKEIIERI